MKLSVKVENEQGIVLAERMQEDEVVLVYNPEYQPGDRLVLESDTDHVYLIVQLEDSIAPALVFLSGGRYDFPIPFEEKRVSYSPRSFIGAKHVLYARVATEQEIAMRKNLAFNPLDGHDNRSMFPHASANVETRGESVFAARNAIDGLKANNDHGPWPYQSWGINQNPQAEWKIEFGRMVCIDEAVFYLRADFPHDAWWELVTLNFSDGSTLEVPLEKTDLGQRLSFPQKTVSWVRLHQLIKANDPSPFPALTQMEFYGHEAPEEINGRNTAMV